MLVDILQDLKQMLLSEIKICELGDFFCLVHLVLWPVPLINLDSVHVTAMSSELCVGPCCFFYKSGSCMFAREISVCLGFYHFLPCDMRHIHIYLHLSSYLY